MRGKTTLQLAALAALVLALACRTAAHDAPVDRAPVRATPDVSGASSTAERSPSAPGLLHAGVLVLRGVTTSGDLALADPTGAVFVTPATEWRPTQLAADVPWPEVWIRGDAVEVDEHLEVGGAMGDAYEVVWWTRERGSRKLGPKVSRVWRADARGDVLLFTLSVRRGPGLYDFTDDVFALDASGERRSLMTDVTMRDPRPTDGAVYIDSRHGAAGPCSLTRFDLPTLASHPKVVPCEHGELGARLLVEAPDPHKRGRVLSLDGADLASFGPYDRGALLADDGAFVVYTKAGRAFRVDVAPGAQPRPLGRLANVHSLSPSGKHGLASELWDDNMGPFPTDARVFSTSDGHLTPSGVPPGTILDTWWTDDDAYVVMKVENNPGSLWAMRVADGKATLLTDTLERCIVLPGSRVLLQSGAGLSLADLASGSAPVPVGGAAAKAARTGAFDVTPSKDAVVFVVTAAEAVEGVPAGLYTASLHAD